MYALKVKDLYKAFYPNRKKVDVLHGISFDFPAGKMTAITVNVILKGVEVWN